MSSTIVDRRQEGTGTLHVIPDHVLTIIFTFFDYKELVYYSSVSATFYVFCNDETLWQDFFLQGTNSTFTFNGSWKNATLQKYKTNSKTLELPKRHQFEGIYSMFLYTRWYRAHIDVSNFVGVENGIERLKVEDLSTEDFVNNYDALSRPVMFTGVTDHWTAHKNWARENLLKVYGETLFKVSERGSRKFKMTMKDYMRYLDVQQDEDPLYIFDSGFAERAPDMMKDYEIPKYFPDDFFELLGKYKPSFRWYVMGPPRSGAPWHVDPAGTSAWNALLHGRKRWLLYPPGGMPPGVIPRVTSKGEHVYVSPSSLLWLLEVYPFLEADDKPIEIIQNPGDVIFVPGGWWHMVLNLSESIAVTQNYANSCNFSSVCQDFFEDRREIYYYFKEKMLEAHPQYSLRFEQFESVTDQITADFDDVEFWAPYVVEVLKRHNLPVPDVQSITPLSDGTNPVFTADKMVVKFYSKHYGGQRNFEAETGMYTSAKSSPIANVCPKLLGEGKIEVKQSIQAKPLDKHTNNMSDGANPPSSKDKENGKENQEKPKDSYPSASASGKYSTVEVKGDWPYLIMSFISGSNLVTAREDEMEIDMGEISLFLARNVSVIHSLKVEGGKETNDSRDDYKLFLQKRREKALKAHWLWRSLSPEVIAQIDGYIPTNIEEIINNEHVFTLHGDLTDENVIGVETKKTSKRAKKGTVFWKPQYLIDFGDSRQGDVAYEFVSLFISVLECNKTHLEIFFKSYKLPDGSTYWDYYNKNKEFMVKKLMCHTLMHECDALSTAFIHLPEAHSLQTIEELATTLWEL